MAGALRITLTCLGVSMGTGGNESCAARFCAHKIIQIKTKYFPISAKIFS